MVNSTMRRWNRRIHCGDTAVIFASGRRHGGGGGGGVLKQLTWRFKSQWKQALGWQTTTGNRHGYDPHSYSQNFDDGFLYDHLSHSYT
ncbi:hypothetical protein Hdeb2414_s0007g00229351 [Helianthus debilis subsp. tardiflorus]